MKKKTSNALKYKPEYVKLVEKIAATTGAGMKELCEIFDVHESTFLEWLHKYDDFRRGYYAGRDFYDKFKVEHNHLRRLIEGGITTETREKSLPNGMTETTEITREYLPNLGAIKMWLHNRNPERYKADPTEDLTDVDELAERLTRVNGKDKPKGRTGGPSGTPESDE